MDITEFLTACVAEDEVVAKAVGVGMRDTWHTIEWYDGQFKNGRPVSVDIHGLAGTPITSCGALLRQDGEHIARHDPARVLREVAAKRRVLARHRSPAEGEWRPGDFDRYCVGCQVDIDTGVPYTDDINDCPELCDMASVYADRPGCKEEWKL